MGKPRSSDEIAEEIQRLSGELASLNYQKERAFEKCVAGYKVNLKKESDVLDKKIISHMRKITKLRLQYMTAVQREMHIRL